jgi:thiol-disulfide isomerase/thioredoxin
VVLVNFWTYTCINWIRTLPYVRAWESKYRDHGLTVIGVHTPEFGFERNVDNVHSAAKDFSVQYPIAIDNDYAIWSAFDNHYWPATYVADGQGRLRYHHFGEGEYAMTEMVIQQLLTAEGIEAVDLDLASVDTSGVALAADWHNLRSSETYLGSAQLSGLASPIDARFGEPHDYTPPTALRLNQWALAGKWTIWQHAASLNEPDGRIAFRFHARDVNLVMGPAEPGTSVPFRVFLDGTIPKGDHGVDVDEEGKGVATEQRLYQLIRQTGSIENRLFEIEFADAGVEAYSFTFG